MSSEAIRSFDSHVLSNLLATACASLDNDRDTARACIQRAVEFLRTSASAGAFPAPVSSVIRGGLAVWQRKRVVAYVHANVGSDIRVPDLANVVGLSTGHFFRAFRESFGESPLAYVTRERIRYSQQLMLRSCAPLSQIALDCGMCDQPHFTRVFRRIVGISPGLWRRQADITPSVALQSRDHVDEVRE
jgi:AraC family transcriptional regulator